MRLLPAFFIFTILFSQCENIHSTNTNGTKTRASEDDSLPTVAVKRMYRFDEDPFAERLQQLFSDYYTATVRRQNTANFFDEASTEFKRHPQTTQNLRLFYEKRFFKVHNPMIVAIYPPEQDTLVKLISRNRTPREFENITYNCISKKSTIRYSNNVKL